MVRYSILLLLGLSFLQPSKAQTLTLNEVSSSFPKIIRMDII